MEGSDSNQRTFHRVPLPQRTHAAPKRHMCTTKTHERCSATQSTNPSGAPNAPTAPHAACEV
eukprot:3939900-Rhodomonas_salina.1